MIALRFLLFALLFTCGDAGPSLADRFVVLHARDGRLYAAWPEAEGAASGRQALLRGPAGEALDTLEVIWAKDAIAALVSLSDRVPSPSGLWIEPLEARARGPRGTLRVPLSSGPATLDPALVTSLAEKQIVMQLFEGLVRLDPRLAPQPGLAARFARSGRRWTFHLREDARFHSGRPVRATDVVASLERALAPATRAPRVDGLAQAIEGGEDYRAGRAGLLPGLRAADSLTIEITATHENVPLLSELAAPAAFIVPIEETKAPGEVFARAPTGSGPFRFAFSDSTGTVVVAAPGRVAGVDTVVFRRVTDSAQAILEFELGRLDLVAPPETEERRIRATGASPEVLTVEEASVYYMGFNTRAPFLREARNRRALVGAVDRSLAVRVLVPGRGRLAEGLLPPVFGVPSAPESAWRPSAFEAESRARALAGQAPALAFWVPRGSVAGLRFAEFVSASLRRLGYRVSIVVRPWEEFQRGILDGRADLFYLSWFADGPDPVAFVSALIESGRRGEGGNRTFYSDADVDRALARARAPVSSEEAMTALRSAERKALFDAPLVPLFHSVNVTLVRPGITGVVLDPLGAPRYDGVEVRPGD